MKVLNKLALFFIWVRQKTFSSTTGIFKDFLYSQPVCSHYPHCSEYAKQCFKKYDFLTALKFTMERVSKCVPSNQLKYDPSAYKVVYFSSAGIGVPFLEKLVKDPRFDVVGVVTMPDAPSGRGQKLKENIIAEAAKKLGINNIFKPEKIKNNEELIKTLKSFQPDFFVVLSYGKILPKEILDIPKLGPINIHGSILPKYRGASPIQSVFLNGEKETGISLMYMDEGLDTGDIIKILKIPLTKQDNAKTLIDKFAKFGPDFFVDALWDFGKGKLKRIKQNNEEATYCGKFTKKDGEINFSTETANEIYRKFQAFYLWPGIYTYLNGKLIKFTDIDFNLQTSLKPGEWSFDKQNKLLKIGTKQGEILVRKIKPEGKKEMTAEEFVNGFLTPGLKF